MRPSTLLPVLAHTQENRLFTLQSPVPEAGLLLDRFTGTEGVSVPFRFELELLSEQGDLELKAFLGKPMGVSLATAGGAPRAFHGHVAAFRHTGTDGGFARYEAVLTPWTDLLRHRINCKLFQEKNLPDLLRELFTDYGHLARYELRLDLAACKPMTLCVQYGESDFAFFSRLLERHGIHYHFRFEEDAHILVLSDDARTAPPMPGGVRIPYNAIPGAAREDTIDDWGSSREVAATAFAAKTFDFKSPRDPMDAGEKTFQPGELPELEHFHYPGAHAYPDFSAGEQYARRRMEELDLRTETFTGASNCRQLTCGHTFELLDHYRAGQTVHDRTFFVTGVHHQGSNNYVPQASRADYRNTFTCVSSLVPYRPPLATPRPTIHGPQTAIVTGPPGEEVFCDEYGRVRIQFHWDRLGKFDEASSCWVRVSSPWAGSRFGFIALPRVGDEVVVEFLDGDPDRPLITGQVYNQVRMPPWELPMNRTQSGLLTRSSLGGGPANANALRFEDKLGAEEVWLHAEKDQRLEVEHDESHTVGHDRAKGIGHDETTEVKHDRTETVGNDERITVGGNRTERVGGNEAITIARNRTERVGAHENVGIGGSQRLSVTEGQTISVGGSQDISVTMTKNENVLLGSTEQVGGVRTLSVGEGYLITVGAAKSEAVAADSIEEVGENKATRVGKSCLIEAGDQLELKVGKSRLVMDKEGKITLSGTELNLEGSGPVKVRGKDVDLN